MSSTFADLGVPTTIVRALHARGITEPFPIQAASLPDSLAGRDVLGRGRTGSGKTVAFALPTIVALTESGTRRKPGTPRALILVPTRELAIQVHETVSSLASAVGLRTMTIFGGVGQNPQVTALRNGVDIVIATPGRLEDLIGQGHCRLDQVEVTVLDEADHMADLGFLPPVKRLLNATPKDAQRLLFSATLDNAIDQLVRRYLHNPVTHSVDSAAAPPPQMTHHLLNVSNDGKTAVIRQLLGGQGRTVAFTRTKHRAKRLARDLTAAGIPAVDLHGNLSQAARQRNLQAFGDGSTRVLVATDIAARGIHVDDVTLVVHVDPPAEHKAYLHRSGRTARAGAEGVVVTVSTPGERSDVAAMMRKAGIKPITNDVAAGHPAVTDLAGPPAPLQHAPAAAPAQAGPAAQGGNAGGRSRRRRSGGGTNGETNRHPGDSQTGTGRRSAANRSTNRSTTPRAKQVEGESSRSGGRSGGARTGAAPAGSTGGLAAFSAGGRRRHR